MPETVHASVVGVRQADDPQAIAWAAASASLDLLRTVKIPSGRKLVIASVSLVEPVGTSDPLDLMVDTLRGRSARKQAVVVTANLLPDVSAVAAVDEAAR